MKFSHPIGLILHNRPSYARDVLSSLARQTLIPDQSKMLILVDGYPGSKSDGHRKRDNTARVSLLAKTYFPDANHLVLARNAGIAHAYEAVEGMFLQRDDAWGAIFEEDFVLNADYLEGLEALIEKVDPFEEVVGVSLTGDCGEPVSQGLEEREKLQPMNHLWAYAVRRSHLRDRKSIIDVYLDELESRAYWKRDSLAIARRLASEGFFIQGTSQDWIKRAIAKDFGKHYLTTEAPFGQYIGELGEHFTSKRFSKHIEATREPTERQSIGYVNSILFPLDFTELRRLENIMRAKQATEFFWGRLTAGQPQSKKKPILLKRIWRLWLRVWRGTL